MNSDYLVIVNPNAGIRKGKKDWKKIRNQLDNQNFSYKYVLTERKHHAVELTSAYIRKGYRKFIVVGGDGTFNEVINGVLSQDIVTPQEIVIGMITIGTGNDWGRMYKIPMDYKAAISVIQKGRTFLQDIGKVEYQETNQKQARYFVNMAGMGFDAQVASKTNKQKEKGRGGTLSYLVNVISTLWSHRNKLAFITIDQDSFKAKVFSMNVGICQYNGGGMKQAPKAIPDDGLLDLTVIKEVGKFKVIRSLSKLYDGTFIKLPEVNVFQGKKISIESNNPIYLEVDGESLGHSPFSFTILPKTINVIIA